MRCCVKYFLLYKIINKLKVAMRCKRVSHKKYGILLFIVSHRYNLLLLSDDLLSLIKALVTGDMIIRNENASRSENFFALKKNSISFFFK
jgi:hypothetical protein